MSTKTYNGHKIEIEKNLEDDCIKLYHRITFPDGRIEIADLSPYNTNSADLVAAYIELGCPTRESIGSIAPLNGHDVRRLWIEKFANRPMPTV